MLAHSRTRFWLLTAEGLEALSHYLSLSIPAFRQYSVDPISCPQETWIHKTGFQMLETHIPFPRVL